VLVFFRFAGCPACNIALPYYERALQPTLKALGVPLVAVSPQIPERLGEIRIRHGLSSRWLPIPAMRSGAGSAFSTPPTRPARPRSGPRAASIGETTGTGTWELPQPTVVVIGPDHRRA
jgi:hypothetical protein